MTINYLQFGFTDCSTSIIDCGKLV